MSQPTANQDSFASGRYSKRKRTQVVYCLEELEVDDSESDYEAPQLKKRKATATRRPLPKRAIFPFLELPAEIRNTIYEYALVDPSGICFARTTKHRRRTVRRISPVAMAESIDYSGSNLSEDLVKGGEEIVTLVPSLLGVSKQILHESRDILYSNKFIFENTSAMYSFLINMGPTRAPLLKTIVLLGFMYGRGSKGYNHACFTALTWATNLTEFVLDNVDPHWYRSVKRFAEQLYRDAFPWLEAVGNAQRKVDAAVDILNMDEDWFYNFYRSDKPEGLSELRGHLRKLLRAQQKRATGVLAKRKRKGAKSTAGEQV